LLLVGVALALVQFVAMRWALRTFGDAVRPV
jgi:hypothetical protein